jgi:hypothetical protein
MNSCDPLPPIAPESACTGTVGTPQRAKMRRYASNIASYETSRPASSASKE